MRISSLVLVALAAGCVASPPPSPPAPAPEPPPARPAPLPPPMLGETLGPQFCIVRNGRLESVEAEVLSAGGDTVYHGVPISRAFPTDGTYALHAAWYGSSEPISLLGGMYVKYGLPRILDTTDVVPVTAFRGVTVFAEPTTDSRWPDVIYLPVRPGCEFQPYMRAGIK